MVLDEIINHVQALQNQVEVRLGTILLPFMYNVYPPLVQCSSLTKYHADYLWYIGDSMGFI